MEIKKSAIRYPGIFAVASFVVIASGFSEVFCPKYVTIEEGDTAMVSCNITARKIVFVYWYKGDTAITSPILRLENGRPGGTEYERGHYNITSNGAMIITDAKVVHEALYTTLMLFQDGTGKSKHINVNITFTPWPSCPIIDGCLPCEECGLAVNDSGKLVCHINGARPIIPVKWIIKNQHGVSILKEPAIFTKDIGSDTWNSSAELSFGVSSCDQEAIILCVAEDHLSLLDQFKSVIRIYTEDCSYTSPVAPSADTINIFIIASVLVAGISAVIVVNFIVIWRKKKMMRLKGFSSVPSDEVPLDMQEITPETVQKLILDLKTKYKVNCLMEPLPWRRPIDVFDLYVGYDCDVTDKNGGTSSTSTDGLLSSNEIISEQRVLITSSSGYGKTLFTKQFVQQWIQNIKSDLILLFITKSEAKANMKLIDFFENETSLTHDDIAQIIENGRCLLFLDGLFNILFQEDGNDKVGEGTHQSHSEHTNNNYELLVDLTLPALFNRLEKSKNTKFQLWMTADDKENIAVKFSLPYVKVTINQVHDKQFDEFVTKACRQCIKLLNQNVTEQDSGTVSAHIFETKFQGDNVNNKDENSSTEKVNQQSQSPNYKLSNKQPEERAEKLSENVREFLKRHQIYQELKENPILLSLIVYTVVRKYLSLNDGLHDFKTPGLEEVISTVIDSLQKAYCRKHVGENTSIFAVSLGKLALGLITDQGSVKGRHSYNFSEYKDAVNLALEMGIVQNPNITSGLQLEDQNTISSWSNYLQFCSKYFRYYYAANYLVQRKIYYNEELAKYDTPENFPVFKFIVHLEQWLGNNVLDAFRKFKTDDEIIDFLLKWDDQEGLQKVITGLVGTRIIINNLTNLEHRGAFKSFCEKCCIMEIKLKSIRIIGGFSVSFITSFGLPVIDELIFSKLTVKEGFFLKILKYLSKRDLTLRFFQCQIAKDLNTKLKEKPGIIDGIRVQISHDDDDILIKLRNCFKDDTAEGGDG